MAKPIAMTREEAAERRLRSALDEIQEAQNAIGRASAALSSLYGVMPESNALGKLYDQIRKQWYRLDEKARKPNATAKIKLDHEPNEYESEFGPLPPSVVS